MVQQSRSRRARRNPKPENDQGDCSRRNERSMKNNQTLQQPITQSRQRGAQTTSAHLNWPGAGRIHPVHGQPMSLATKAIPKTRLHFRHFRGLFICIYIYVHIYNICTCPPIFMLRDQSIAPNVSSHPILDVYTYDTYITCTHGTCIRTQKYGPTPPCRKV